MNKSHFTRQKNLFSYFSVVITCLSLDGIGPRTRTFLLKAREMGMTNGDYVFIMGRGFIFSGINVWEDKSVIESQLRDKDALQAFRSVLMVIAETLDLDTLNKVNEQVRTEMNLTTEKYEVWKRVDYLLNVKSGLVTCWSGWVELLLISGGVQPIYIYTNVLIKLACRF